MFVIFNFENYINVQFDLLITTYVNEILYTKESFLKLRKIESRVVIWYTVKRVGGKVSLYRVVNKYKRKPLKGNNYTYLFKGK